MGAVNISGILKTLKIDFTKKETRLTITIVFLAGAIAYSFVFIKPALEELLKLRRKVDTLHVDINQVEGEIRREGILKKRLVSMKEKISLYENKLPTEHEVPILLEDLSRMAQETYVKIKGINPSVTKGARKGNKKPYREIPIQISAQSGYHELGEFINKMENTDRFMKIQGIQIKSNPKNMRLHNIELDVSTFILLKE